jgi:hypothetical protein
MIIEPQCFVFKIIVKHNETGLLHKIFIFSQNNIFVCTCFLRIKISESYKGKLFVYVKGFGVILFISHHTTALLTFQLPASFEFKLGKKGHVE